MATYIQIDEDLPHHHKTARLAKMLERPLPEVLGYLDLFWLYTLKVAWRDGDLSAYGDEMIESNCHWKGEPGKLVAGLRGCGKPKGDGTAGPGFLDGFVAHDWVVRSSRLIRDRLYREEQRAGRPRREPTAEEKEIQTLWNDHAKQHTMPHAARPPQVPEQLTPARFKLLLETAQKQPFLYGGKDGWRMSLEWLIGHFDKVMAEEYRDFKKGAGDGASTEEPDYRKRTREILAKRNKENAA